MKNINILSLFTGCGGLDLGFELVKDKFYKYNIIWANDSLKHACETFSKNFKAKLYEDSNKETSLPAIYFGDVRDVSFSEIFSKNKIDIVLGGFPCQDFSLLRGNSKRQGIKVTRGRLYLHFVRALIETQPKFFVAENVKGLVSANKGKAFEQIINDFENLSILDEEIESDIGYKINTKNVVGYHILHKKVIDFSHFGVPQKRKRLIIIGVRKDLISKKLKNKFRFQFENLTKKLLFEDYPLTALEAFTGKIVTKLDKEYKSIMAEFKEYISSINSPRKNYYIKNIWNNLTLNPKSDYLFFNSAENNNILFNKAMKIHKKTLKEMGYLNNSIKNKKFSDGSNDLMRELKRIKLRMSHIPPGENHKYVRNTVHQVKGLMSNIYRRLNPLKPSTTIIANGGGGTWGYHYENERQKLTNRERARIQSFPDWFEFSGKSGEVRTQIGNAVPPFGIKTFAEELLKIYKRII